MSLSKSRFIEMFGRLGCDDKKWGMVSLGEFCSLNPQKSELNNISDDTEVSFLPMSSVSENGELTLSERKQYGEVKSGFSYFADGDVLFAKITPCMENGKGAVAKGLCNNIGFGSTEFHVLRVKTSVCNPYWLYELLSLRQFRKIAEQNMTGSAGQKRVPAKFLQNFKLSLPPIKLQNEYVSISQQIDKSKFLLQKILEKLELLKKSRFIEMFDLYKEKKLSEVAEIIMGQSPDSNSYNNTEMGLPFYQGKTEFSDKYIGSPVTWCSSPCRIAEKNDILMSVRAPVGDVNIATEKCCIGRGLASIRPLDGESTFLFYALKLKKAEIASKGNGSTFKAINKETVHSITIPDVPQELKVKFSMFAEQIDKSKLVIQKSLEDLVGKL